MKTPTRLLALLIATALLPAATFAAKGDKPEKPERRNKKEKPAAASAVSFSSADKDRDGSVSESEYAAAMKSQLGEDAAKLRFGTLDKNHDGKLSSEEFGTGTADTGEKKKRRKKDQ